MIPEQRLRKLLHHAWDKSAFYRNYYTEHGIKKADLDHVELADLPVVGKEEVMLGFDQAVTDPRLRLRDIQSWMQRDRNPRSRYLDEYLVLHSSAGSSIFSYTPYTLQEWRIMASTAARYLLPDADLHTGPLRSAFYFGTPGHWASTTNVSMASRAAHDVLQLLLTDPVEEVRARLNAFQPQRLHGYASTMRWLAEWTLAGDLRIRPDSVVITGDRLTRDTRALIGEAWGAQIYEIYAASESLFAAIRQPEAADYEVLQDLNILEVVDPDLRMVQPGERGRVLMTSFSQSTLPLIRFNLYDWATLGEAAPCGARTLRSLDGKTHHFLPLRRRDGTEGRLDSYALQALELPGVTQIQLQKPGPDEVEIWYSGDPAQEDALRRTFTRLLDEHGLAVDVVGLRHADAIANEKVTFKYLPIAQPGAKVLELPAFDVEPDAQSMTPLLLDGPAWNEAARTIPEAMRQVAAEYAQKIALWDEESELSYEELDRRARQVASLLWQSGVDLQRPLGVMAAHRPATAAILLGCLYAGGFYVVLDPAAPLERLSALLESIRPGALLSDAEHLPQAESLSAGTLSVLSSMTAEGLDVSRFQLPGIDADQPACLIYTSGTTGVPKGIVLSHRVVLARVRQWIEAGQLCASDRVSLLPSPGVNAGTRGMYSALLSGAQLCFYDLRVNGTHRLARWLKQAGITVFYTLPSVWDAFVETLGTTRLPDIRLVRLGGEALTEANVASFGRHFDAECVLVNGYASTEAGTICLYFLRPDTKLTAGRVPVGYAAPGVELVLSDEAGMARHDRVGEVSVRSESMARGMWDGAAGTVRAYPAGIYGTGDLGYQLPDGRIFLTGRKGLWLNLHGYRVNLTDLESVLAMLPEIEDVAAVADTQSGSETRLRVFYVLRQTMTTSEMRLHHAAAGVLPSAALSVTFHAVESLPRRVAGKLNRAVLLQQIEEATATPLPHYDYQDPVEATLAEIWGLVLSQPGIAPEADFFALGGDSLLVFRTINRIQETFEIDLSVTQFFEAPTLTAQAALLRQLVWN